jgi:hypothetical protein
VLGARRPGESQTFASACGRRAAVRHPYTTANLATISDGDRRTSQLSRSEVPILAARRLRGQRWKRIPRAPSLHRRRLRLLEHVVVERLLEDRRVDQADDVLKGAQAGDLDHGLHSSPIGDDTGAFLSFWLCRSARVSGMLLGQSHYVSAGVHESVVRPAAKYLSKSSHGATTSIIYL